MSVLRCAAFAREERLDPVGTAGTYDGYLLVAHPLPWGKDIGDSEELAPLVTEAAANRWRLQGVVPDDSVEPGRVVRYRRPAGAFAGLVSDDVDSDRIVLVCTHGRRDVCCGSLGCSLWDSVSPLAGVRVWRTSHTGGHRFAPTAIVLPEATLWAYLEADLLRGIVERSIDVARALPHYRGCSALGPPEVQAADREALARHGWAWLDTPRRGEVVERHDDGNALVRLSGGGTTYEAEVEVRRMVPVPDCGKPIEEAKKAEPELRVRSFTEV